MPFEMRHRCYNCSCHRWFFTRSCTKVLCSLLDPFCGRRCRLSVRCLPTLLRHRDHCNGPDSIRAFPSIHQFLKVFQAHILLVMLNEFQADDRDDGDRGRHTAKVLLICIKLYMFSLKLITFFVIFSRRMAAVETEKAPTLLRRRQSSLKTST